MEEYGANSKLIRILLGKRRKKEYLHYLYIVLTYFIALVLLFSGISKIIEPEALIENLYATFSFLPGIVVIIISTLLPIVEVAFGILLVTGFYNEKVKSNRRLIGI